MLTESQAWALIAHAPVSKESLLHISIDDKTETWSFGLCHIIEKMIQWGTISRRTDTLMKRRIFNKKIQMYGTESVGFLWPTTQEGHRERQEFAREMAKLTEEK